MPIRAILLLNIRKVYELNSLYDVTLYTFLSGTKVLRLKFIARDWQIQRLRFENIAHHILLLLNLPPRPAFPIWYDIVWIVDAGSTSCGPQTEFLGFPVPIQINRTFKEDIIFGKSLVLKFQFNFHFRQLISGHLPKTGHWPICCKTSEVLQWCNVLNLC